MVAVSALRAVVTVVASVAHALIIRPRAEAAHAEETDRHDHDHKNRHLFEVDVLGAKDDRAVNLMKHSRA